MYVLHGTKKLLDRIKEPITTSVLAPTTALGNWYATALFWKPQLVLFVNERTLLPVLMPLASATTTAKRFPSQLATVLTAHGVDSAFIGREVAAMAEVGFAKTANRSVVGIMNEFSFLAETCREYPESSDLIILSMRLADTPCSPIKYNCPARLLKDVVEYQVV
ncbi:DUF6933 domain-containing protein [Collimonas antrihumi]|uniref:DUF6933 domain-containing protein n=1 Tax=Collimonas antrihumi TaxID=1940615 RepID=UPI001B8AB479|nr:hypothetical protein [Collimonas antrihumi]